MRQFNAEVEVAYTPELLAKLFCELNSYEQANFFEHIAYISESWGSNHAETQWLGFNQQLRAKAIDLLKSILGEGEQGGRR